jgi:hypothetical protein
MNTYVILLIILIFLFIAYKIYNSGYRFYSENFNNDCKPGQLKNFGICMGYKPIF